MKKPLLIYGTSSFSSVVVELVKLLEYQVEGFIMIIVKMSLMSFLLRLYFPGTRLRTLASLWQLATKICLNASQS